MSKGKRKSMDDVLASMGGMKAARPAPEPAPVEEPVGEAMAVPEKPVEEMTFEEIASPAEPEPDPKPEPTRPAKVDSASTRTRAHVRKEEVARQTRPASVPRGYNVRPPRIEKPHQSIYADPAVWKVIRQIAMVEDVKPQDLYREALRTMLKKRGYDFDKLDRGEA